jgi:hypothetical protein
MDRLRIIVSGFIGLYPTGGVTWDYIQYPLGLNLLGHDVYYIEDTMQYSGYQTNGRSWDDSSDSIHYLKLVMERFGLGDKWAYRDIASGKCFGMSSTRVAEIFRTADVFINISESTYLRDEYLNIPKRVLIDSDPMFTQVQYWNDDDPEASTEKIKKHYGQYNYRFTFGENVAAADCAVPTFDMEWMPTRQPVCLSYWKNEHALNPRGSLTTVMNWSTRKKLKYRNNLWGQKDAEFEKILHLPRMFGDLEFKIAASVSEGQQFEKKMLEDEGWVLLSPTESIPDAQSYQNFILNSMAEFSVAKETYVKSKSGWFSCRSACYLASGRPVVTQETGWSEFIPSGEGLFAFTSPESAAEAIRKVHADPAKHARAASEIAQQYFDSNRVLQSLLDRLA